MSKHIYTVEVGNVGTVYNGPSIVEASKMYSDYVDISETRSGSRAGGEDVVLFKDGEPVREHEGLVRLREDWTSGHGRIVGPARSKHRRGGY